MKGLVSGSGGVCKEEASFKKEELTRLEKRLHIQGEGRRQPTMT